MQNQAVFQQAFTHHQHGRLAEAARLYQSVLQQTPRHFDALHLLGVIALQSGEPGQGVELISKAIRIEPKSAPAHLNLANAYRALGQSAEAVRSYSRAISLQPDMLAAYYDRGVTLQDLGRHEEAIASYDKAIALKPDMVEAHFNRGVAQHEIGHLDAALSSYDRAIWLEPSSADAHLHRGRVLKELVRLDEALVSLDRAIALLPDLAEAHTIRGNTLMALHRAEEAVASYNRVITLQSERPEAYFHRGVALQELGRHDAAIVSYERATALRPDFTDAHFNCGVAYYQLGQGYPALSCYDRAIAVSPELAVVHLNRGLLLKDLTRLDEALDSADRAIALQPDDAEGHTLRGNVLLALKRANDGPFPFDVAEKLPGYTLAPGDNAALNARLLAEAIASYDRAITLAPDRAAAYYNRNLAWQFLGDHARAISDCDKAIELNPTYADAIFNKAWLLLLHGDLEHGWPLHEARKQFKGALGNRRYTQPSWTGAQDLAGKTLFVHWEQGFGDTLQFARYAKLAHVRGARVVLSVQDALVRLMQHSMPDIEVIGPLVEPAAFDYHAALLSMPLAFGTTLSSIPAEPAYLRADAALADAWKTRLPTTGKPRIGLAWSGNAEQVVDLYRSVAFTTVLPLLDVPADWVSLQVDVRDLDVPILQQHSDRIFRAGPHLTDFADTAALIEGLDLVITTDTSVAHLAAALGKPVWLMLSANPDWRWLLGRDDSPWYPTMRLFRQPTQGDWPSVMQAVLHALQTQFG